MEMTNIYREVSAGHARYYSMAQEGRQYVRNPFKLALLSLAFGIKATPVECLRRMPISLKKEDGYLRNIARYTRKQYYKASNLTNQSWLDLMRSNEFIVNDWNITFVGNKPNLSISGWNLYFDRKENKILPTILEEQKMLRSLQRMLSEIAIMAKEINKPLKSI